MIHPRQVSYRQPPATDDVNDVFFDLIVEQFDTRLRNGIAHGGTINDSNCGKIRLPSTGATNSYDEFTGIVYDNYLAVSLSTGMLPSLIKWWFHTLESDEISRGRLTV